MRSARAALGILATALLGVGAFPPGASAAPSLAAAPVPLAPPPASETCAWPWTVGVQNYNRAFPDSAGAYWAEPIVGGPSTGITVTGTYPDARYFSLSVYTPYGTPFSVNGASSSLPDYRIAPAPGSTNPWQHQAPPGGSYRVTVRPAGAPGQPNVLPLPPGTSASHPGYLVYRVYLPASGSFSHLKLPTITVAQGSENRTLPACSTQQPFALPEKAPGGTTTPPKKVPTPPPGAFYNPALNKSGGLADPDTAYVWAYIFRPALADVVVVSAKAPTFPPGRGPSPWPAPGQDMQYWSMCMALGTVTVPTVVNHLPGGQVDYGCRADEATKLDSAGDYNYVIGSEAQRAAISRVAGATFLPFSSTQTTPLYLILFRNILVNPAFAHSAQKVTTAGDAPAAAAAMGPYDPHVSTCPLAILVAKGLPACKG